MSRAPQPDLQLAIAQALRVADSQPAVAPQKSLKRALEAQGWAVIYKPKLYTQPIEGEPTIIEDEALDPFDACRALTDQERKEKGTSA